MPIVGLHNSDPVTRDEIKAAVEQALDKTGRFDVDAICSIETPGVDLFAWYVSRLGSENNAIQVCLLFFSIGMLVQNNRQNKPRIVVV